MFTPGDEAMRARMDGAADDNSQSATRQTAPYGWDEYFELFPQYHPDALQKKVVRLEAELAVATEGLPMAEFEWTNLRSIDEWRAEPTGNMVADYKLALAYIEFLRKLVRRAYGDDAAPREPGTSGEG